VAREARYAELEAADMICRRAAALFDAGKECGADANMAKLLASDRAPRLGRHRAGCRSSNVPT